MGPNPKSVAEVRERVEADIARLDLALAALAHPGWKPIAQWLLDWKTRQDAMLHDPYLTDARKREQACVEVYVLDKMLALPETFLQKRKDLERELGYLDARPKPLMTRILDLVR